MKRLHYADNISAALCWQGSLPLYRNHGEWPTDGDGRHSVSRSKNEPGHRDPLIQNQGGKLCLGSFISLWLWKGPTKFIWFQKFIILSTRLYSFHKIQVVRKAGLSTISKICSTSRILHHFGLLQFLRFTNQLNQFHKFQHFPQTAK